jgi:hypothetical protein
MVILVFGHKQVGKKPQQNWTGAGMPHQSTPRLIYQPGIFYSKILLV